MNVAIAILLALSVTPANTKKVALSEPSSKALFNSGQSVGQVPSAEVSPKDPASTTSIAPVFTPTENKVEDRLRNMVARYNPRLSSEMIASLGQWMVRYSEALRVEPALVAALIARESGFNPEAVSPTGAQGLGQLTAAAAKDVGVVNALDPEENIRGTTAYLSRLMETWKGRADQVECALASYYVGHRVVRENNGVPPVESVRKFVDDVLSNYRSLTSEP